MDGFHYTSDTDSETSAHANLHDVRPSEALTHKLRKSKTCAAARQWSGEVLMGSQSQSDLAGDTERHTRSRRVATG